MSPMASAGVSRTIDSLGRVVVPVEFRRALEISREDVLEISLDGRQIVITKVERSCTFCGGSSDLRPLRGKLICTSCIVQLVANHPSR